jgi:2-isopropylmalate synthase
MSDIEKTWGAIQDARHRSIGIHTFIATSPEHIEVKFPQKTPDDIVDMAREAVRYAREVSEGNAVVEFSAEVATGTPLDFLERVVKTALDEGANVINLPDTKGEASPKMIRKMFKAATSWMIYGGYERDVTISTHCHNDFGFATANTTSAVQAVIETSEEMGVPAPDVQAEVVWGGRGERAGNSSAEQVVMAMQKFAGEYEGLQLPKLDITRIAKLTQVVFSLLNMEIPANAPIIGKDVRTHRSGIHADAIVKGGARIYAPYDPQWVGHPESAIIAPGGYQGTRGNNNLGPWHKY